MTPEEKAELNSFLTYVGAGVGLGLVALLLLGLIAWLFFTNILLLIVIIVLIAGGVVGGLAWLDEH